MHLFVIRLLAQEGGFVLGSKLSVQRSGRMVIETYIPFHVSLRLIALSAEFSLRLWKVINILEDLQLVYKA